MRGLLFFDRLLRPLLPPVCLYLFGMVQFEDKHEDLRPSAGGACRGRERLPRPHLPQQVAQVRRSTG